MSELPGQGRAEKKTSRGSGIGCVCVCTLEEVGHQLVNKARPSPGKSVGAAKRHAKDAGDCSACLHAHPRRQTTLNGEPTTRLLAWEIAIVDSF
jgi:hypothetical protein